MPFFSTTTTSVADWEKWTSRNIQITDRGIALARSEIVQTTTIDENVRDVAIDQAGTVYTLSASDSLFQYNSNTDSFRMLTHPNTNSVTNPTSLCTSEREVYIAEQSGRIKRIPLRRTRQIEHVYDSYCEPTAIVYDSGTIRLLGKSDGLIEVGDANQPVDWTLTTPVDATCLESGWYAIDDAGDSYTLRATQKPSAKSPNNSVEKLSNGFEQSPFMPTALAAVDGSLFIAVADSRSQKYGIVEWDESEAKFAEFATLQHRCYSLAGTADQDGLRTLYAVVGPNRRCKKISETIINGQHPKHDRHLGIATTRLDSGVDGIEWHRITFDRARSSVNTQVRIRYRATDNPTPLSFRSSTPSASRDGSASGDGDSEKTPDGPTDDGIERLQSLGISSIWGLANTDPVDLADRDNNLTIETATEWQSAAFDYLESHIANEWKVVSETTTQDILLDDATGRYLEVAVELIGTSEVSPLVDSVTAYCPRQSYLRYMPELYQSDSESATFLERFLSVFETSFEDIQSEIDESTKYVDPQGVPSESLPWLEEWLAATDYQEWPESARREYLSRAPELYRLRGTRSGLRETIELYLRHATDGVDRSDTKRKKQQESGDLPTGHRYFTIDLSDFYGAEHREQELYHSLLPTERSIAVFCGPFESAEQNRAVDQIIQTETPAHVDASLQVLEDEFSLGDGSFLGLNTELATQSFALGDSALGQGSYLTSEE